MKTTIIKIRASFCGDGFSRLLLAIMAKTILRVITPVLLISLSACSGSVNVKHPVLQGISVGTPTAKVYFIRPRMLKPKGVSDNVLSVAFDNIKILDIHAGSYTLISIKPGQAIVSTQSSTTFTNSRIPIKVSRQREYNFIAGKTYFIHLDRVNEEFRGVFFDPKPVNLATAKTLLSTCLPFGAAKHEPIEEIVTVEDTPMAGDMPPVLPENLYKEQEYLLTPHPFKR